VVVDPAPTTFIERDPGYRYYCPNPAGFYPAVPTCPVEWLKVLPPDPPAATTQPYAPAPGGPPASPQ
jgi:hypothetical protein